MLVTVIFHSVGLVIAAFGIIFINALSIISSKQKENFYLLNVSMLILGCILVTASFGYVLYFRFKILNSSRTIITPARRIPSVVSISHSSEFELNSNLTYSTSVENLNQLPHHNDDSSVYYICHQQRNQDNKYDLPPTYDTTLSQNQIKNSDQRI